MDLYCYRLVFILLFFFGCEQIENNLLDEITFFEIENSNANYNSYNNELSIYLEVSDFEYDINSIYASIIIPNTQDTIKTLTLEQYKINPYIYYLDNEVLDLPNDIYIYDINYNITFDCYDEPYLDSISFTKEISPYINSYTMQSTFELHLSDWTLLPIDIEIVNLNGIDNIDKVKYEIQRIFNGCEGECIENENCNEPIIDQDYLSDESWIFENVAILNDTITHSYSYHVDIPMRPLSGEALYDEEGQIVFPAKDCAGTGVALFKFIVEDIDGLSDDIMDIELEITD